MPDLTVGQVSPTLTVPANEPLVGSEAITQPIRAVRVVRPVQVRPVTLNVWGWFPALSVTSALGLVVVAAGDRLSGSGVPGMEPLYWLGLLMVVVPITARLMASKVYRPERLGLVVVFGLSLYGVKVLQSPYAFTYSDEFIHVFNANQIADTGHLFTPNPILPVSGLYPGLESATVALTRLAGLDVFSAGLIIVGLARLVMMLGLFLLYEQVGGSARSASLAAILYAANSNFLYWSAQFSYESLALPLAILVLLAVARRESGKHAIEFLGLTLVALLVTGAVVVTHHLSSYFLAGVLLLWTFIIWLNRLLPQWLSKLQHLTATQTLSLFREVTSSPRGPAALALFAIAASAFWLFAVANLTFSYLSPMFSKAGLSLLTQLMGDEPGRGLFHSTSGVVSPTWERVVGIAAVLLCLIGLPFGLRQVWRRYRFQALGLLMGSAAIAYFGLLGLRLVPSAWEISNRSSEFLFLGLAFVLAVGRMPKWFPKPVLVVAAATIFAGGIIAGWPSSLRMAQVYQVPVGDRVLQPAGLTAALWARERLGEGNIFAADESNGRYLMTYGNQNALTGRNQSINTIFDSPKLADWQLGLLSNTRVEYLAVDRRKASADNMLGYFFTPWNNAPITMTQLLPVEDYGKFQQLPDVSRIYDSGDLVLYDVRRWINALPQP